MAVRPQTARFDEKQPNAQPRGPMADEAGDELGLVIRFDVFRDAVPQHQPGQHPQNVPHAFPTGNHDGQAMAGVLAYHRQDLQAPALAGRLEHEVGPPTHSCHTPA